MASRSPFAPDIAPPRGISAGAAVPPAATAELWPWRAFDDPALIARWDALAQAAAEPNPFFESWYLLPALKALDPAGEARLLVVEEGGQWLGIMPLSRRNRYYGHPLPHWETWLHPNCFCGVPLVARGAEQRFWRAVLAWADAFGGTPMFLHLPELPLHGPVERALTAVLAADRRPSRCVHLYQRAMLQSPSSPEEYFAASVNGKRRKELRRLEKRLGEHGQLEIDRQRGTDGLDRWIDEFLALERSGWKGTNGSALASNPATAALFREALHGAAERGRLERLTLRLDGRAIAGLTSFFTPPGTFAFKTAYDEEFAASSPGVLLQREFLAVLDDPEIAWCDSCAAPDHPMIDHLWRERRAIARLNVAVGGAARRALFKTLSRLETGISSGALS